MWRLRAFLERLLREDEMWASIRLMIVLAITWLFILAGRLIFHEDGTQNAFFTERNLRFMVAPVATLAAALIVGAHYVQDIYELKGFRLGWRYLMAALFGFDYPRLVVSEGKKQIGEKETNLLDVVGGPGFLVVQPGNVVLLTRLTEPAKVCPAGVYFVARGELVQEIASLSDQHGFIEEASATTKDGIEVTVRDIHYQYRLRAGRRSGDYTRRTPASPYPYLVQAVRNMAYRRIVTSGGLASWHDSVKSAVGGVITDYISQHQLDPLTAPSWQEKAPRAEIARFLSSRGTRERLKDLGAELLWFDIGHFDIRNEAVGKQRTDTWAAKWLGHAEVVESYGEAQRVAYRELGRAEAQAEMLMSIISSLEEAVKSGDSQANLRKIVLLRSAQLLEALSEAGSEDNPPKLAGSALRR